MTDLLERIRHGARQHGLNLDDVQLPHPIVIEPGASRKAAAYLKGKGHQTLLLVADDTTFQLVGRALQEDAAAEGLIAATTLIEPNEQGDVVADEASIVQVLLDSQKYGATVLLAVGAGTIHDIVRYAAYTLRIPFVGVPTAPSVDGFTSMGAPLILRGEKITIPAVGPAAIYADTDILRTAPNALVAAGFGDMIGKVTSLFDWQVGRLVGGEPYDEWIAAVTREAMQACVDHVAEIAERTEKGILILMEALLQSGLAMLVWGTSHPASGAEHHLSHYWEMELNRNRSRQLLHGAKVGVATTLILELYHKLAKQGAPSGQADRTSADPIVEEARLHWEELALWINQLPGPDEVRSWLRTVQGPETIEELGISSELAERALCNADRVRPNRHTLLQIRNRCK